MKTHEAAGGAARWPVVSDSGEERGQKIKRRRAKFGFNSVSAFYRAILEREGSAPALETIKKAEDGAASTSDNTYLRLESFLDRLEEEAGYERGELLSSAEAELAQEPEGGVIEFDVEGPSSRWHVHAKASKGNADEAIAALAKLIRQLREDDGDIEG